LPFALTLVRRFLGFANATQDNAHMDATYFVTPEAFRDWLARHHAHADALPRAAP
jgi:hypothetical protein